GSRGPGKWHFFGTSEVLLFLLLHFPRPAERREGPTFPDIPPDVHRGGDLSRRDDIRYGPAEPGGARRSDARKGRRDDPTRNDHEQAHPRAVGAASCRRRHARKRTGVSAAGAAERAGWERPAAGGPTTGRCTRERAAAVAGGLGTRARHRDSRRHARL